MTNEEKLAVFEKSPNRVSKMFRDDVDTEILNVIDFDLFHIECLLFRKKILTHIYFNNALIPKITKMLNEVLNESKNL